MNQIHQSGEQNMRIAIIDPNKCKPKKCNKECKKYCPVNRSGSQCVEIENIAKINDNMCTGCGACPKVCPFGAIRIIRYPRKLSTNIVHQYDVNSFRLHKLPIPKKGAVVGLLGANGLGKSTALDILAGKHNPNFGKINQEPDVKDVLKYFRGTELQSYFNMQRNNFKVSYKVQNINNMRSDQRIQDLLSAPYIKKMDLEAIQDRRINDLSGGELQRFVIGKTLAADANLYIFDEPTCYLDVKQRLNVATMILEKLADNNYIILVEHDLAILDYISDYICLFYGYPTGYGVVSGPHSSREGINWFLDGYIPAENMRIGNSITFRLGIDPDDEVPTEYNYNSARYNVGNFSLEIEGGRFCTSETYVMLGENGMGKTTLAEIFVGNRKSDPPIDFGLTISYKPQILQRTEGTVGEILFERMGNITDEWFRSEVIVPLRIDSLMDVEIRRLSGGELQKVMIALTLGRPAHVYLLDEPSAFLDAESRIAVAKLIRRFVKNKKVTAFVIDHDLLMNTYIADKIILFTGKPGISCTAQQPVDVRVGVNAFLKSVGITVRKDISTHRPRINKQESQKDKEQ